jgi:hypothetical protein
MMAERSGKGGPSVRARERGERRGYAGKGARLDERAPNGKPYFVRTEKLQAALAGIGPIDYKQFREDIDACVDQDPTPLFLRTDRSRPDRHVDSDSPGVD